MDTPISISGLKKMFISLLLSTLLLCSLLFVSMTDKQIVKSLPPLEDIPTFHKYNINCKAIYDLDPTEVEKSLIIRKHHIVKDTDESLFNLTSDCPKFIKARGYDRVCVTDEERDFPIAYSLVVHKYAWMVERLIRAIYSPANIYCIHYDEKSPDQFKSAIEGFVSCLPNVFVVSKREIVYYTEFSRVQADLNCFVDLLKSDVKWKYIINLCGQDFPLRTNIELVSGLKSLNGSNMLESTLPRHKASRFKYHFELTGPSEYRKWLVRTDQLKPPPPHGIEMFVGSAYFILSREFIVFMDSSVVMKDFVAWIKDTLMPEETIWATLLRIPGAPGGVPSSHPEINELVIKTRITKWSDHENNYYPPCTSIHIRGICIYGAAEVRWLLNFGHWFLNKLDPNVDPITVQCLEEILKERQDLFGC
ncbi:beta-1,3-galactosyl-O-glycosyl-glycoprotein beta-1,6-N-acetylglucosaminyltransferase 4-like [Halichoeres trimaculatus]|uniref:beta-1,3-galactosyl-O-glycosyl-glycoprotein beta-1,6-N-acetylglucosaminyltransferase 4-like n=1 Tax=Halichoeres trimaculatus TaxID=147232 RepID=UPI003D9EB51E